MKQSKLFEGDLTHWLPPGGSCYRNGNELVPGDVDRRAALYDFIYILNSPVKNHF